MIINVTIGVWQFVMQIKHFQTDPDTNGMSHQSMPTVAIKRVPARALGPKIVAVTSPRPLIVQVQSLTQAQSLNHDYGSNSNDFDDMPNGKYELNLP